MKFTLGFSFAWLIAVVFYVVWLAPPNDNRLLAEKNKTQTCLRNIVMADKLLNTLSEDGNQQTKEWQIRHNALCLKWKIRNCSVITSSTIPSFFYQDGWLKSEGSGFTNL